MAPVAANADSAFSPVTNITGTAYFTVGSVADGGTADNQEELYMQYAYIKYCYGIVAYKY
jgi:hypothetical protein